MNALTFRFRNTTFDIVDRAGLPWLRSPQIGEALGYAKGSISIHKLYEQHANEFTADMTALVRLPTEGGEQETRIFSPRGCYALGMFARTAVAKEFRVWVLDVLEGKAKVGSGGTALPRLIDAVQAGELATLIAERFPEGKDRPYAWGRFNNHFRIARYREMPASRFAEAQDYIRAMPGKPAPALPAPAVPSLAGLRVLLTLRADGLHQAEVVEPDKLIFTPGSLGELLATRGFELARQGETCSQQGCKFRSTT